MSNEQNRTRRPRWLRYSTRGLLVLVLLICVLLGIYLWLIQDLREQQALEARLKALNCRVAWGGEWSEWDDNVGMMLIGESPTPTWVIAILDGDPNARITYISAYSYESADELRSALDIADEMPDVTTLVIDGKHRDPPRDRLAGFRSIDGILKFKISQVDITSDAAREIGRMTELRSLSFWDVDIPDEAFDELRGMNRELEFLIVSGTQISSDCLPAIGQLSAMRKLALDRCNIGDKNIESLQQLSKLIQLSLDNTKVTDAALPKLAKISSLRQLTLRGNNITDANLEYLGQLPKLRALDLHQTNITDAAFAKLAKLSSLRTLNLSKTNITGQGLSQFAAIPGLRLELYDSSIDDDCVDELLKCQELESLNVTRTNLSIDGWLRLKEGLPNTEVSARL